MKVMLGDQIGGGHDTACPKQRKGNDRGMGMIVIHMSSSGERLSGTVVVNYSNEKLFKKNDACHRIRERIFRRRNVYIRTGQKKICARERRL